MGLWAALVSELQQSLSRQSIVGCVDLKKILYGIHLIDLFIPIFILFIFLLLKIEVLSSLPLSCSNSTIISVVYFGGMCCLACVYTIILHIHDILYPLSLLAGLYCYCNLYKLFSCLVPLPLSSIPINKKRVLVSYLYSIIIISIIMSLPIHLCPWY